MSPTEEAPAFPRPFGSKYMLLRHLATGGMADVFLARQTGSAGFMKEIVIKRILPHLARDQQFVTMFLDEARLCARLNHPNIAQVFDLGQVGHDYFIAMEHIDGVDLEQLLEVVQGCGEERVPFAIAARIVAAAADGLQHAHNAVDTHGRPLGIVHRDVTPSNVMVSFDGVPKILDFGIAKATHKQAKTEVGIVRGKAPYMSPEQVEGENLDGRSDLFSLGCILYELITGNKPFVAETAHMVGVKILHDDPTPPSLQVDDVPEKLEAVVLWALAKRRNDRIPSALVFHQELEKFLLTTGTPSTAHDVAAYLAKRFPRDRSVSPDTPGNGTPIHPAPTTDERRMGMGFRDTLIQEPPTHDTLVNASPTVPFASTTTPRRTPAASPGLAKPNESISEAIARIRAATNPRLAAIPADTPPSGLAMNQRPNRPTGHITLGEVPEEPTGYKPPRSLGGGGGKWMVIVIFGLVVATGVSLLLLRDHEQKKIANAEQTAPEKVGTQVPPVAGIEPKPTEPGKPPEAVKVVEPSPTEIKTTATTPPATPTEPEPKVTPLAPEKPEKTKHSSSKSKSHHHHSSSSSSSSSSTTRTLPRLPTPPPEN